MFGFGKGAKFTKDGVEVRRRGIKVEISKVKREEDISTGNSFLDVFLRTLSTSSPLSIRVTSEGSGNILKDSGFAIGLGLKKLLEKGGKKSACYVHSDGKRMCMFSLETSGDIRGSGIELIGRPKEFDPGDLFVFFDSLSQGMDAEVRGVINLGRGKKEVEFVSEAFGFLLKQMFEL